MLQSAKSPIADRPESMDLSIVTVVAVSCVLCCLLPNYL